MPLPQEIDVTGAGSGAANGRYQPCAAPNATYNGAAQFTNGTDFLVFYGGGWYLTTQVNDPYASLYANPPGASNGSQTTFPTTGWTNNGGVNPIPTFASVSAPVPNTLSFRGTTGTLTWTENQFPPVQNGGSSFTFSGAGDARANGTYTQIAGSYNQGSPQFTNGMIYLENNGNGYETLSPVQNLAQGGQSLYHTDAFDYNVFDTAGNGWQTGTYNSVGTAPPPTWVANAGKTMFGPGQGLTITGLSGGAVTVTNVVTNGTTTTFSLSRAIAANETDGTFSGAASAFCDSSSPVNLTAAFTIPITSSMFGSALAPPRNLRASFID